MSECFCRCLVAWAQLLLSLCQKLTFFFLYRICSIWLPIGALLLPAECDGGDIKYKSPCEMSLDNSNCMNALISFRMVFEIANTHPHLVLLKVLCFTSYSLHWQWSQWMDLILCSAAMEIHFTLIDCVVSVRQWDCTVLAWLLFSH